MNKLSKKFIIGIAAILLVTMSASIWINSTVVSRYYLHEKKKALDGVCDRLEQMVDEGEQPEAVISILEDSEEVVIAQTDDTDDLNLLNESVRDILRSKGIGFQKFWLWEGAYQTLLANGRKISVYSQDKLNYSLLVEYMTIRDKVYAVVMVIPHVSDAIRIINTISSGILLLSMAAAIFMVAVWVKRITKPLDQMKRQADDISSGNFHSIEVRSHDELEEVADSMNQMCGEIQSYQSRLLTKNQQMEELLDNVAHDLKTPVALVSAYANGIKDGLDDGTFVDTIIRQNSRMGAMVEGLLYLSRMKKRETDVQDVALDMLLGQLLEEQALLAARQGIAFQSVICAQAVIWSNEELVRLMLDNFFSNSLKYSSGKIIDITLEEKENGYLFTIANDTDTVTDPDRIWEPFYVGEKSRNKELSGTGLGLALVKGGAEKIGCPVSCRLENSRITFQVFFQDME